MKKIKDYKYIHLSPKISAKAFIAEGARLIGAVSVGDYSSVWYNAVIRADINEVVIGAQTNIQDLSVLHVSDEHGVKVADFVTVGHGAILHGCTVGRGVVVGMGAELMEGVSVGEKSMIAAGSLLPPGFIVPPAVLVKGHPAKVARKLTRKEIEENLGWADKYKQLIEKYRKQYAL